MLLQVLAVKCEVRDPHSVRDAVSECIDTLGHLPTIIINNAAGNFVCPSERLSVNAWRSVIDIVLMGTVNVTMDIGKRLIAAGYSMYSSLLCHSRYTSFLPEPPPSLSLPKHSLLAVITYT